MTIVFQRDLPGEETAHALVIGVGHYPHFAQPGDDPPDLESATRGAEMFADCLIRNADSLRPRLGSLDLLLSPAGGGKATYLPQPQALQNAAGAVDPRADADVESATAANVLAAGKRWRIPLTTQDGNMAILYLCGHGVATPSRSMVFLQDARSDPDEPWNPYVNPLVELTRLRRRAGIPLGCIFVDACQEIINEVILLEADKQSVISDPVKLLPPGQDDECTNAYMLVPGPMGALAWDDERKIGGRFTQVLVNALDGAAAYNFSGVGTWGVRLDDLHQKMKCLYGLNDLWADGKVFKPAPISVPIVNGPLVRFQQAPKVPVCIRFAPEDIVPAVDRLQVLGPGAPGVTQNFPLVVNAGVAGQAAWTNGIFVVWPQAAVGEHAMQIALKSDPAGNGHPWPNAARATRLDISEMRVEPVILHDVS